jgi:hypothetical protein
MYDVWHVLAADDSEQRQASRTATAVANKRVKDQFGKFLASDTEARFEFVKDEIEKLVQATADEYGADPAPILAGILASLTPEKQIEPRTAAVVEARKPKLCPYHSEVMDVSLADGNPRAGFDAMAQHAFGPQHCKGEGYEGGKCNFRREYTSTDYWDQKAEQAEQRRQEREEAQAEIPVVDEIEEPEVELIEDAPVEEPVAEDTNVVEVDFTGEVDGEPSAVGEGAAEELAVAASTDAPFPDKTADVWGDPRGQTEQQGAGVCPYCQGQGFTAGGNCPSCGGTGRVAGTTLAEALETVDIEKDTHPDFKREIHDKTVPDAEMDGTPHPTKTVDIVEPIVFENNDDGLKETDAVLEKQDVTKDEGQKPIKDNSPRSQSTTDPVTSAAADVATNPVREILLEQDEDGFLDDATVAAAVAKRR